MVVERILMAYFALIALCGAGAFAFAILWTALYAYDKLFAWLAI